MQHYSSDRSGGHYPQPARAEHGARHPRADAWLIGQTGDPSLPPSAEDAQFARSWTGALPLEDAPAASAAVSPADGQSASDAANVSEAPDWDQMTLHIGPRTAAGMSYLLWWFSGLIVYFNERRNIYVRFHAMQSILLTGALTIFSVLVFMTSSLLGDIYLTTHHPLYHTLSVGVAWFFGVLIAMLWIAPMIAAWSGEYLRLPIVGTYAERYAALPPGRPSY